MTRLFEAKPFIIAEVGSNWRNLDDCLVSIGAARACGADAVKFQAFNYEALYGPRHKPMFMAEWGHYPGELNLDWLPKMAEGANEIGIEFICTAFSPELVAAVDPFVNVHKVASSDANCPQMLEAVAKTGKPVLISFGAATDTDEGLAVRYLRDKGVEQLVTMACTASYPADYSDPQHVEDMFDWQDNSASGYSDHTLGYTATVVAARDYRATVIEKHFTAFPDLDTPDRPHSLTPDQFKRMVDIIRGREVESEEKAMHLRHKRRLIATQDISPGHALRFGVNFGAYRSLVDDTRGASPWDWEKVNGRMAKGPIERGAAIALEDVE